MTSTRTARQAVLIAAAAAAVGLAGTSVAGLRGWRLTGSTRTPSGCIQPNRSMTLYAEQLPRTRDGQVRLGYGLTPKTATIPGPLIELTEGDCLAVTLVNDIPATTLNTLRERNHRAGGHMLPLGVSLHVHGVKYTTDSDGTVHTGSYVPPGQARTYTWYAAPRVTVGGRVVSIGTAGYWWYHDHVIGTDHGTAGSGSGLFGGVVVRRPGDPLPVYTHTVVMGPQTSINLRRYPDTDTCRKVDPVPGPTCFVARRGERTEFIVIGVGNDFHTFHLHGHNWADNRTGMLTSQADETALIDTKTIGPAESFGFQVIAGEEVGDGAWMLHCHVQQHSDAGMMTFFHVIEPDGTVTSSPLTRYLHVR
ncbi:MAG: multicopper oxidase domain-containing protein [Mycobacteriales bacterium]|nr:multicopper oxidase domain-containing protein [Frankia sp.]